MFNTKEKSSNKPLIVYWAIYSQNNTQFRQMLLDPKPTTLKSYIVKNKAKDPKVPKTRFPVLGFNRYHMCSAFHELAENTFIVKAPFSARVDLEEDGSVIDSYFSGWFIPRLSSLEDSLAIDFDMPYLFFAEESVNMKITPPYMTRTVQQDYGFPTAVKFNIAKWFRPLFLPYQLWSGVKALEIKENDPLVYINFETDRPIILKQFIMTDKILQLADACMSDKNTYPQQQLKQLYSRFKNSRTNEIVLNEIKNNLLDK